MANDLMIDEDELKVDEALGYPKGYSKICRDGSFGPYRNGPPYTFAPFALPDDEVMRVKKFEDMFPVINSKAKPRVFSADCFLCFHCYNKVMRVKKFEDMFPVINSKAKPTTKPKIFLSLLWKQLSHIGNAGFDPEMFRVDAYGNVLYYHADRASPLAWDIDHWFPCSRGGFTVPSNLRILQWQVCRNKQDQLEFLIPWWDLQVGVSINQFLSIFAATNSDFRHRAFSWLFSGGESEELNPSQTVDSHSFPQHFKESKDRLGLAPAAIVLTKRDTHYASSSLHRRPRSSTPIVAVSKKQKSGAKENEDPNMEANPYQAMVLARDSLRQRDQSSKMLAEIKMLDDEVIETKMKTEEEKLTIQELESVLMKRKRRAEKCRRLAEAQSSYRSMLEKMIRDAMHQSVIYKEQLRLNQAASNALMARLEAQRAICDSSERDLHLRFKQKDELEKQVLPEGAYARKRTRRDDYSSDEKNDKPILLLAGDESKTLQIKTRNGAAADDYVTNDALYLTAEEPDAEEPEMESQGERCSSSSATLNDRASIDGSSLLNLPRLKSKAQLHKELRVFLAEEQKISGDLSLNEEELKEYRRNISRPENMSVGKTAEGQPQVSEIHEADKIFNFQFPGIDEPEKEEDEESRNQRGKGNVEKWLQILLENSDYSIDQEYAEDREKKTVEIIRKLNLVYPSQDPKGAYYAKDSDQDMTNGEALVEKEPKGAYAKDSDQDMTNDEALVEKEEIKGKEQIVTLKPRRKSTSSSLQYVEKTKDASFKNPPYRVNDTKAKATEVDFVTHEVTDSTVCEEKESTEKTGKEKELTRSESAIMFRRIPSSPSLILSGMKKRVDSITKKPKVMGENDRKKSNVAEESFLRSSVKTIKRVVRF